MLRAYRTACCALALVALATFGCGTGEAGPDAVAPQADVPQVADGATDASDAEAPPSTYRNPILAADYSDPDAVRVGDDYWMISSSFNHVPGLPLLHSRDLVTWTLEGHALPRLVPEDYFSVPRHGKGVWAPSLRVEDGLYRLYYPDPEAGLYLITATDPRGAWSPPVQVVPGPGRIDPCPFRDDDGTPYLVHAWAKSYAGINNRLTLLRLAPDGRSVAEDLGVLIDGDAFPGTTTLEGPKVYRRNGWVYVLAPAGGVTDGWQLAFRARSVTGPYEARTVLARGATDVNGPHQGALVDTPSGEWWFLHFQDRGVYGRIVHLEPVAWVDDWPVIGDDPDADGTGQPVAEHARPDLPAQPPAAPATSDAFDGPALGPQWQWQANPQPAWASLDARPGFLRLTAVPEPAPGRLYDAPNLLLQKLPAEAFTVTATLDGAGLAEGERAGLVVFGFAYSWLGLARVDGALQIVRTVDKSAVAGSAETASPLATLPEGVTVAEVRVSVAAGGSCRFDYRLDGTFVPAPAPGAAAGSDPPFQATAGRWVGAKVGVFAAAPATGGVGHVDVDEERVDVPPP